MRLLAASKDSWMFKSLDFQRRLKRVSFRRRSTWWRQWTRNFSDAFSLGGRCGGRVTSRIALFRLIAPSTVPAVSQKALDLTWMTFDTKQSREKSSRIEKLCFEQKISITGACRGEIVEAQGLAESHLSKAFFAYRRVAECRVQKFYGEHWAFNGVSGKEEASVPLLWMKSRESSAL